ncbi:high-affinity methionine permease [Microdochium trichocladiopsis]|uniref:High-affinity methionine permease n=1 Tax=Microdochium trichocladiopsis TaxID=1682393 RepID=A0A9P9BL18_9PEZI|nr:high-affinity methionine permease [Microdochium trichocladiopsis]KAH7024477.1 high-affinity methionine permease [Microdochium trichocladiopsis]
MPSLKFWQSSGDHHANPAEHPAVDVEASASDSEGSFLHDGNLAFVREKAGNDSGPQYQEAVGAPVESNSPLGYNVGWVTVIFLNVNQMIGTGIFSTPGSILRSTGSVGLAMIFWLIGFLMSLSGLAVNLEFASYFPGRSGGEVAYLEQSYPRPKYFFPIAFAVQNVILSFSSSNAVVLSRYLWRIAAITPSDWQLKGVAVAAYTLAVICVLVHNKYSLWAVNVFGVFKVLLLVVISITGLVVLGGSTHIQNPHANWENSFQGTTNNGNDLANAIVNIVFSYSGYENAFKVVNEIKRPVPTLKKNATASVLIVSILYILCNVAYFSAVPKAEFAASSQTAAAVFFTRVFGPRGANALNVFVLLSAFGNLLAVLIGHARMIREIGRQGVLPYPRFWVTTWPFGTPIGPYLLKWVATVIMIIAPPAGDAFTFAVSLQSYPSAMFSVAMAVGLYLVRHRFKRAGLPRAEFEAWHIAAIFFILVQIYVLVMPWVPPKNGPYSGDVSFWYATYCVTGIAIIIVCALYYVVWMYVWPKFRGYKIRPEVLEDVDSRGANTHRLVQVPLAELAAWDEAHDDAGRLRRRHQHQHQHYNGDAERASDSSAVASGEQAGIGGEKGLKEV